MEIANIENKKVPKGTVTLVGLGRLGLRTALNLMQVHRGGPEKIVAIDGQKISDDDLIFKLQGGTVGEYKVDLLPKIAGERFNKQIVCVKEYITPENLDLIEGDVVCVEIAGGDTLPTTASIIKKSHAQGALSLSTAGVFGIGKDKIKVCDISQADASNPIIQNLKEMGINENHLLIGTGKLIRDWEPVTPYVLDQVSAVITAQILKLLQKIHENE
jgi:predicted ThiF/HesA family dinucleotide-utilizing enzyme